MLRSLWRVRPFILLLPLAFGACAVHEVTVGVENARFQHGYLNSKLLGPGTLLVWDMEAASDRALTLAPNPDVANNESVRHAGGSELVSRATSGITLGGAAATRGIPANAEAHIASQTAVRVCNFASVRFRDPKFVLNEEDFARERVELGRDFADHPSVRFILIAGTTLADDVQIAIGKPKGQANVARLSIAGKKYELAFHGIKTAAWLGCQEPVFIQPRVYKLVSDDAGATGYRFIEDRTVEFDLTEMLTDATTF